MKYGPDGILSYSDDQAMRSQMSGRANIRTQDTAWQVPLAKDPESTVQKTVRYGLMPAGPSGNFPGSNSHALGIPAGTVRYRLSLARRTLAAALAGYDHPPAPTEQP